MSSSYPQYGQAPPAPAPGYGRFKASCARNPGAALALLLALTLLAAYLYAGQRGWVPPCTGPGGSKGRRARRRRPAPPPDDIDGLIEALGERPA